MAGVSATNYFNEATGDATTTVFNFTFFAYEVDEIKVYEVTNDVLTEITSGITKAINSSFIGGTITFDSAPADGQGILIRREVDYTQETEFENLTRYKETAIETALNRIVLQVQQLGSGGGGVLSPSYNESNNITDAIIETPVADSVLVFSGTNGRIKAGATLTEVENAEANATAAAASAASAASQAAASAASAAAALVSETAAANSLASFNDLFVRTTSDPTVNDDVNDGYLTGTQWINSTNGRIFILRDNSSGAAVWLELMGLTGGATHFENSGNNLRIESVNNQAALTIKDDGANDGAMVVASTESVTTADGAKMIAYAKDAVSNGDAMNGAFFVTACTDGDVGRIYLENHVKTRRSMVVNGRFDLVTGTGYSAVNAPDADGNFHVFGDSATLGTSPELSGYTASTAADMAVFEQGGTIDNGISGAVADGQKYNMFFGHQNDNDAARLIFDFSDDSVQHYVNGAEAYRLLSAGNLIGGKTVANASTAGWELRKDGLMVACKTDGTTAIHNRNGTEGDIVVYRKDSVDVAAIKTNSGGDSVLEIDKLSFDGGVTEFDSSDFGENDLSTVTSGDNVGDIDILNLSDSETGNAELILDGVEPVSNASTLQLVTSTNNGSSFDTGASDYKTFLNVETTTDTTKTRSTAAAAIDLATLCPANQNRAISGSIKIYDMTDASSYCVISWDLTYMNSNGLLAKAVGSALRFTAADVDAVKLKFSAGNSKRGNVRVKQI